MTDADTVWVPTQCTLPTVDQPMRVHEYDHLIETGLLHQTRLSPVALRWSIRPQLEDHVRELTARETRCCSFFSFRISTTAQALTVEVEVPPAQVFVLDALAARAEAVTAPD